MTEIGPHLLGRIPSPDDKRDFPLHVFRENATPLDAALATMLKSKGANPAVKAWATIATSLIEGGVPQPIPTPTPTPPAPPTAVSWANSEPVLDQGDYGTCVGNGCAQWGNTLPIDDKFVEKDARAIYYEATVIDGDPDDPDKPGGGQQGATVRSGMKALQNRKRLSVYASAASVVDACKYVLSTGPIVMGTDWTNDMFNPDSDGFVKPTGGVAGGHCYLLMGYDPASDVLTYLNSWGDSWGLEGNFKMHMADAVKLFADQGEAWAAVELA